MKYLSIIALLFVGSPSFAGNGSAVGGSSGVSYSDDFEGRSAYHPFNSCVAINTNFEKIRFIGKNQSEVVFEMTSICGRKNIFSLRPEELNSTIIKYLLKSQRENGKEVKIREPWQLSI